jgi:flagellar hook-associated protein 1
LDDIFNGFQSFAASPTDQGERQMLEKGGIFTDRFHLADQRLAQGQSDVAAEVSTDVAQINRLLSTLAELNTQHRARLPRDEQARVRRDA